MAYTFTNSKGNKYILHSRQTTLKNGAKQTIYFFAKEAKDGALDAANGVGLELPAGAWVVAVNGLDQADGPIADDVF